MFHKAKSSRGILHFPHLSLRLHSRVSLALSLLISLAKLLRYEKYPFRGELFCAFPLLILR